MNHIDTLTKLISIIEQNPLIYRYLKNCPYQILNCWSIIIFKKGEKIICQGEKCNDFYLIDSGLVDVNVMSENGKCYSHAIYKEGNYLGELEIFDQIEYCCNAIAITEVCVLQISRTDFLRWIDLDKDIQNVLLQNVCSKFYTLSTKAAVDYFYSLKYRLCEFLLQCIKQHKYMDSQHCLMIHTNELSSYLAVTNRSINRIIVELREKGIIETKNSCIRVINVKLLEEELSKTKK